MKVEVRRDKSDRNPLEFEYDFGANTLDAASKFNTDGPYGDVVHHLFIRGATMQLREQVGEWLAEGLSVERIQQNLSGYEQQEGDSPAVWIDPWTPTIKHKGRAPVDKAAQLLANLGLSQEERDALVAALQGNALPAAKAPKPKQPKAPKADKPKPAKKK